MFNPEPDGRDPMIGDFTSMMFVTTVSCGATTCPGRPESTEPCPPANTAVPHHRCRWGWRPATPLRWMAVNSFPVHFHIDSVGSQAGRGRLSEERKVTHHNPAVVVFFRLIFATKALILPPDPAAGYPGMAWRRRAGSGP